jgi:hypothetical protein
MLIEITNSSLSFDDYASRLMKYDKINNSVSLTDEYLKIVLIVLEDSSSTIRSAGHTLLGHIMVADATLLRTTIEALISGLSRHPSDRHSIYQCFKLLGDHHASLVDAIVHG